MRKGLLALDIDGTLTHQKDFIPDEVKGYLKSLYLDGWELLVITGRSFPFALNTVKGIDFPFILATQNGSNAWKMPSKENIFYNYISKEKIDILNKYVSEDVCFFIYGFDFNIFYKKNEDFDDYFEMIKKSHKQEIFPLENISENKMLDTFPLAKFVSKKEIVERIKNSLEKENIFDLSIISDPFMKGYYMLLVTNKGVNKGNCIKKIIEKNEKFIIAAGNDNNDLSMFETAHISIGMKDSPKSVIEKVDIIAPAAKNLGIIDGLKKAIEKKLYHPEMEMEIKDLEVFSFIGVYEIEKKTKKPLLIDLNLKYKNFSDFNDNISNAIDYDEVISIAQEISEKTNFSLLESLAKKIVDTIFDKYLNISFAKIKIKKPSANGNATYCAIEYFKGKK